MSIAPPPGGKACRRDGILFPSNSEHGAKIVEDDTTINCKNIVPGWSVYHARWEK